MITISFTGDLSPVCTFPFRLAEVSFRVLSLFPGFCGFSEELDGIRKVCSVSARSAFCALAEATLRTSEDLMVASSFT